MEEINCILEDEGVSTFSKNHGWALSKMVSSQVRRFSRRATEELYTADRKTNLVWLRTGRPGGIGRG